MEIRNGAEEVKDPEVGPVPDPADPTSKLVGVREDFSMEKDPNTRSLAKKKGKRQTPKKGKKVKGHKAASKAPTEKKAMAKKKAGNGDEGQTQFSVDLATARAVRRLRAQMELETNGERVTIPQAIKAAVEAAMK